MEVFFVGSAVPSPTGNVVVSGWRALVMTWHHKCHDAHPDDIIDICFVWSIPQQYCGRVHQDELVMVWNLYGERSS